MEKGKLVGHYVQLRKLSEHTIPVYISMFSGEVKRMVHVMHEQSELEYLHQCLFYQTHGLTFFYCIFEKKTDALVGAIEIRQASRWAGQLYCWLHENYWGKGYFQEAMCLASNNYFKQTAAKMFSAHVDTTNKRSYYALKKCGFADLGFCNGPHGRQYKLVLRTEEG